MSAVHLEEFEPERLVKSTDRVRDLGEVYTPANIVDEMLNLIPAESWGVHPAKTFLEPSVGNGNFVSAILSRKLSYVDESFTEGSLAGGKTAASAEFHALEALASIYGVDISEDNIIGGTPGHEIACRPRLLTIMERWRSALGDSESAVSADFMKAAQWIVEHNMIIGNMLEKDAEGKRTDRESIPFVEYTWDAKTLTVAVALTNLGDILTEAEEAKADVLSLFGAMDPQELWNGPFLKLGTAPSNATTLLTGSGASNSKGKR